MLDWVEFAITTGSGGIIGFLVWFLQSRIETLHREKERLFDDRRQVYLDVLDPFIRLFAGMKNPKENQKALQQIVSAEYKRTAFEFTLIGDDEVVRAFNEFMQHVYAIDSIEMDAEDPKRTLCLWGDFLLEVRKNLGNKKTSLDRVDMLASQITDISKLR